MAIAFLNDPERQHALAHLRKQMMLSNPQECMLCTSAFESSADIRFCPCCAMVSCASCVSKRVFEVVSRQVVSVCVHCFRESSRVRHPPQAVLDSSGIDVSLRGKWWRPEELGMVDYSQSLQTAPSILSAAAGNSSKLPSSAAAMQRTASLAGPSIYNENDMLVLDSSIRPLIPGILDDIDPAVLGTHSAVKKERKSKLAKNHAVPGEQTDSDDDDEEQEESGGEEEGEGDSATAHHDPNAVVDEYQELAQQKKQQEQLLLQSQSQSPVTTSNKSPVTTPTAGIPIGSPSPTPASAAAAAKTARCKSCGLMISRDMDAIEAHMEECNGPLSGSSSLQQNRKNSVAGNAESGECRYSVCFCKFDM